jgi:2-phosphoglycerate kinase
MRLLTVWASDGRSRLADRVWSDKDLVRRANRRLTVLQHAEEVSGNVAARCRYYRRMNPMSSLMTVVGPIGTISGVLGPSGTFSGLASATLTN